METQWQVQVFFFFICICGSWWDNNFATTAGSCWYNACSKGKNKRLFFPLAKMLDSLKEYNIVTLRTVWCLYRKTNWRSLSLSLKYRIFHYIPIWKKKGYVWAILKKNKVDSFLIYSTELQSAYCLFCEESRSIMYQSRDTSHFLGLHYSILKALFYRIQQKEIFHNQIIEFSKSFSMP